MYETLPYSHPARVQQRAKFDRLRARVVAGTGENPPNARDRARFYRWAARRTDFPSQWVPDWARRRRERGGLSIGQRLISRAVDRAFRVACRRSEAQAALMRAERDPYTGLVLVEIERYYDKATDLSQWFRPARLRGDTYRRRRMVRMVVARDGRSWRV